MELKIKDKSIYTEEAQESINDFEKMVMNHFKPKDSHEKEIANATYSMIEAIDTYINLIKKEENSTISSFEMCDLSLITRLCQSQQEQYIENVPNLIKEALEDLLDKIQ